MSDIRTESINVNDRTKVSQAYFNRFSLFFYDFFLYGFISKYFWGCSINRLLSRNNMFIGKTHLDVGVGTSYLLDKLNPSDVSIDLMDLSENCLKKSADRLKRYSPTVIQHNILEPIKNTEKSYQSISLNYVMHCVPGRFSSKAKAFGNLKALLDKEGVLFGISVLNNKGLSHLPARWLMTLLNVFGVFNNLEDDPDELKEGLEKYFKFVEVQTISSTVLFFATDDESLFEINREKNKRL